MVINISVQYSGGLSPRHYTVDPRLLPVVVVVVVVVSHIQRIIGCQPEKNYFTRWPIPLVVC